MNSVSPFRIYYRKKLYKRAILATFIFLNALIQVLYDSLITESQRTFVNEGIDAPSKGFEPKKNEIQKELIEANQTSMSMKVFSIF